MTRSVFIVDDHPMVIEGIRQMLTHIPDVVIAGHATTAASCLGFMLKNHADVVLLDINLPDGSGIDVCKTISKKYPQVSVIALSNYDQLTYRNNMKDAGAKGYLLKNASADEIEKAINAVTSGKEYWLGKEKIRDSIKEDNTMLLTQRELEVLRCIAEGLTNHEIADKLFVSESTVDSHRKNLISKLHAKNTAAMVRMAMEQKLI